VLNSTPRLAACPPPSYKKTNPIDSRPLKGKDRYEFRKQLLDQTEVKGSARVILDIIFGDFCRGAADCFPSNEAIAQKARVDTRHVRRVLRDMEDCGAILCVFDQSIRSRRRIVFSTHPNAANILADLRKSPFLVACNPCLSGTPKPLKKYRCKGDILTKCKGDISCDIKGDILCRCKGVENVPRILALESKHKEIPPPASSENLPPTLTPDAEPIRDGGDSFHSQETETIPCEILDLARSKLGNSYAEDIQANAAGIAKDAKGNWLALRAAVMAVAEDKPKGRVRNVIGLVRDKAKKFAETPDNIPSRFLPKPPPPPALDPLEGFGDLTSPMLAMNPEFEKLVRSNVSGNKSAMGQHKTQEEIRREIHSRMDNAQVQRGYHPETVKAMKAWADEEIFPAPLPLLAEPVRAVRRPLFDQDGKLDEIAAKFFDISLRGVKALHLMNQDTIAAIVAKRTLESIGSLVEWNHANEAKLKDYVENLLRQPAESPISIAV
jgi:hypothetical protein